MKKAINPLMAIMLILISITMSCGKQILTQDEYQQTKGDYKSESYIIIDKQPLLMKDQNVIECKYRIHHAYSESPPDWINDYRQYGNVIDVYWIYKSLTKEYSQKKLANTIIINSSHINPEIWVGGSEKIKPDLHCIYWLEFYERNPWKNEENLLLRSDKIRIE